ncbi:MAG: PCP reductase family protein [Candidatus Thiodiazotropha sp.]
MSNELLPWDEDALQRIEKIPAFVRKMAKAKIEKAAREAGETRVSSDFIEANKAKLMG